MKILVSCLLLASFALAEVHSVGTYQKFRLQHTYNGNTLVDCETFLNPVLKTLNKRCKRCNTVILGDQKYTTDINEVINICSHGTHMRDNLYKSHRTFRVVTCQKKPTIMTYQPPYCKYNKVSHWDVQHRSITVGCENGYPVHFEGC